MLRCRKSVAAIAIGLVCCGWMVTSLRADAAEVSPRAYEKHRGEMAVVLLDVNWGRYWNCAGYENAQLISLRFENTARAPGDHSKFTQIKLASPSRPSASPQFESYGFLVEPGTYALTEWSVKAAKSVSDVGYLRAGRDELVENDIYLGGTIDVEAGEVVYIGNFYLDCYYSPIPWRYYTEGINAFERHAGEYKARFRFLDNATIKYRLLETDNYGTPYDPE